MKTGRLIFNFLILFFFLVKISFAQSFYSRHFKIVQISSGVYAAIAEKDGHAICNAGIIDLGDSCVVIDPFLSLDAAEDLKKAAETLTGHPVAYVINTHFHDDHSGGNQVFKEANIISTNSTRVDYLKRQKEAIERDKTLAPVLFKRLSSMDTVGMTQYELEDRRLMISYFEAKIFSADLLRLIPAETVFTGTLILKGNQRQIRLIETPSGHTKSDLVVWLEKEGVIFAGDLVFSGYHPSIEDGNLQHWIKSLNYLKKMKVKEVVPGHGELGGNELIETMIRYFKMIVREAKKVSENKSKLSAPSPFDTWHLNNFYLENLELILK